MKKNIFRCYEINIFCCITTRLVANNAIVKLNETFFAISSNHSKGTICKPRP